MAVCFFLNPKILPTVCFWVWKLGWVGLFLGVQGGAGVCQVELGTFIIG